MSADITAADEAEANRPDSRGGCGLVNQIPNITITKEQDNG